MHFWTHEQFFSALDIPRGAVVVDVGAGRTGHFALHAAEAVGDKGKVFAVDIIRDALSMIASSAALRGLHHVQTLWVTLNAAKVWVWQMVAQTTRSWSTHCIRFVHMTLPHKKCVAL